MSFNTINFDEVSSRPMGGPPSRDGFYKVLLTGVTCRQTKAGNTRLDFVCEIAEGPEKNSVIFEGFNFPTEGQSSKGLRYLKHFLLSFSIKPANMWEFILNMAVLAEMPMDTLAECISPSDLKLAKKMASAKKLPSLPTSFGHCRWEAAPHEDDWPTTVWFSSERWNRLNESTSTAADAVGTSVAPVNGTDTSRDAILDEILSL